jgi:hypothetical protein
VVAEPPGHIAAQKQIRPPSGELPGSSELVRLDGSARGREDEQHGQIGGGVGENARCIADDDLVAGRGGNVDVVVTHGVVGDSRQFRLGEQVGVEPVA